MFKLLIMKKVLLLLLFIPILISLNSCGSMASFNTATVNTNLWIEKGMLPSQLLSNGDVFLEGKLSDGYTYSVFSDDTIDTDSGYYYNSIMQDFGWAYNGNKWQDVSGFARRIKYGALYVNPRKRVAVYIYPERIYSAFKVKISGNPKSED